MLFSKNNNNSERYFLPSDCKIFRLPWVSSPFSFSFSPSGEERGQTEKKGRKRQGKGKDEDETAKGKGRVRNVMGEEIKK